MRSYLLKSDFKCNLQKYHFLYVYEVIIKCYPNFITCLYFSLSLIRWNSSQRFKEKVDSNNNWKTACPRMILEWLLFLRLSLGFVRKMLSFVGKHLKFLTNKCLFIFCIFYLHEEELNQQVCLIKYVESEISNSILHKKEKERERPAKT